jgi:hypothetical protein
LTFQNESRDLDSYKNDKDTPCQCLPPSNLPFASLIFPADIPLGPKYRRILVSDSTSVPVHIARIGDGNIARTGDSRDSGECYSFHMKSLSAIRSGQISPVASTASDRHEFICADKHK